MKFSREAQKSGSVGGTKSKWYLFDQMLFVKRNISDKKTTSNIEPLPPDDYTLDDDVASQASQSSFSLDFGDIWVAGIHTIK